MGNYAWLDDYLCSRPGAEKQYQEEWQAFRYLLRGKMFCMVGGDREGKPIVTLKLEPAHGELLRSTYPGDVVPGYYMNKQHWNSVYFTGAVPDGELRGLVDEAHQLVLASLSKKAQEEILRSVQQV